MGRLDLCQSLCLHAIQQRSDHVFFFLFFFFAGGGGGGWRGAETGIISRFVHAKSGKTLYI